MFRFEADGMAAFDGNCKHNPRTPVIETETITDHTHTHTHARKPQLFSCTPRARCVFIRVDPTSQGMRNAIRKGADYYYYFYYYYYLYFYYCYYYYYYYGYYYYHYYYYCYGSRHQAQLWGGKDPDRITCFVVFRECCVCVSKQACAF